MYVIFYIKENTYYSNNKDCHWTKDISEAQLFKTKETAQNYAKHGLKDKVSELDFLEYENGKTKEPMTKEEAEKTYEKLKAVVEMFGEVAQDIPALLDYYTKEQSNQDKLQEDLLHKIELSPMGNLSLIEYGRQLKKCRQERRAAKDRVNWLRIISDSKPVKLLKNHENFIQTTQNRGYKPRIAKDLF